MKDKITTQGAIVKTVLHFNALYDNNKDFKVKTTMKN